MNDAGIAALKLAFAFATSLNEWATAVVVAGVAIELVALLLFSKSMSRAEKIMLVTGSLLVVVGVGGEYVFGGRAASIAAELQQESDKAVAGLKAQQEADHKIATEAAAHAADLGVSIDNLHTFVDAEKKKNDDVITELQNDEARLSKARDDALAAADTSKAVLDKMTTALEAERTTRDAMTAAMNARTITDEQKTTIIDHLKTMSKDCKISVVNPFVDSTDAKSYSDEIREVLGKADVTLSSPPKKLAGVLSWSAPGAWLETSRATDIPCGATLQRAFAAANIYLEGLVKPDELDDPEQVVIIVSSHPFKPEPVPPLLLNAVK